MTWHDTAKFCKARAVANEKRAKLERDAERRRYFEREASSWRGEQLFAEAVARRRA